MAMASRRENFPSRVMIFPRWKIQSASAASADGTFTGKKKLKTSTRSIRVAMVLPSEKRNVKQVRHLSSSLVISKRAVRAGFEGVEVLLLLRPLEVLVQELKGPLVVDRVRTNEPLDLAAVANPELRLVEEAHLGKLVADGLVGSDPVEVAALDHERPRGNQSSHFRIVEGASQVKFE